MYIGRINKQIINIPATPIGVVQNEIFLFTKPIKIFVEPRWGSGNTTLTNATDIKTRRDFIKHRPHIKVHQF